MQSIICCNILVGRNRAKSFYLKRTKEPNALQPLRLERFCFSVLCALLKEFGQLRRVLMQLINGEYAPDDPERFRDIYDSLLNTNSSDRADTYFILKDFKSYAEAQKKVEAAYKDEKGWAKSAILNTACSGKFTSDRTIQEYVDDIWKLDKVVLPKKKEVKKTVTAEEK